MGEKRKPNRRRVPRELRRPPNGREAMDIAVKVYQFADLVADGKPSEAIDAIIEWIGDDVRVARLHSNYLAFTPLVIANGIMRKHFPVEMEPDDLWVLEHIEGVVPTDTDVHKDAVAQAFVRHLNNDDQMARDITEAHLKVHGDEGLFWFGVEAVKLLAGIIKSAREQGDQAVTHG